MLPSLEYISLSGNQIGSAGLTALAPALRQLPKLELLNLNAQPDRDHRSPTRAWRLASGSAA